VNVIGGTHVDQVALNPNFLLLFIAFLFCKLDVGRHHREHIFRPSVILEPYAHFFL
jgi:hypothetical protein